jgi:hypothetical protein
MVKGLEAIVDPRGKVVAYVDNGEGERVTMPDLSPEEARDLAIQRAIEDGEPTLGSTALAEGLHDNPWIQ